jgi:hypothetical protein
MTTTFAGVWREGTDGYALWVDAWDGFAAKWEELSDQGLRLVSLETFEDGGDRFWAGVFQEGTDGHYLWVNVDWDGFVAKWEELAGQNLRLVDVETWVEGGSVRWAGVWREGTDGHYLWADTWDGFVAKWEELSSQNLRLVDIETFLEGGERKWCGVWREGSGGHYLWAGDTWDGFVAKWNEIAADGLRLVDIERFEEGGQELWAGVWREGWDGYFLWGASDWENFVGQWDDLASQGLRLLKMTPIPAGCDGDCADHVVSRDAEGKGVPYDYYVTGDPDGPYSWPVDGDEYVRPSALYFEEQPFVLPFTDPDVAHWGTWLYSPGSWHHAIDYVKMPGDTQETFRIRSAAKGKVVFIGYDAWSGNTIIVSHKAGGVDDAYRTIYMHLRNGPANDCSAAWAISVPILSGTELTNYKNYLEGVGCPQDPAARNPDAAFWGSESDAIDPNLLNQEVEAGQFLAWAGCTGPGGCGATKGPRDTPNTHLHIFFCRKDQTNGHWYFIDPYGIYSFPDGCYPAGTTDPGQGGCVRYSVAWKDGTPQYPPATAMSAHVTLGSRRFGHWVEGAGPGRSRLGVTPRPGRPSVRSTAAPPLEPNLGEDPFAVDRARARGRMGAPRPVRPVFPARGAGLAFTVDEPVGGGTGRLRPSPGP